MVEWVVRGVETRRSLLLSLTHSLSLSLSLSLSVSLSISISLKATFSELKPNHTTVSSPPPTPSPVGGSRDRASRPRDQTRLAPGENPHHIPRRDRRVSPDRLARGARARGDAARTPRGPRPTARRAGASPEGRGSRRRRRRRLRWRGRASENKIGRLGVICGRRMARGGRGGRDRDSRGSRGRREEGGADVTRGVADGGLARKRARESRRGPGFEWRCCC